MNITKEAVAQLEKLKQWLKQSDEKSLDAFSSQNAHLVLHFYEMYQRFIQGDKPMNVIKPTETTPIYTPNKVIQLTNGCQDEPYHCSQTDDEVVITEVKFSPECGLSWNTESKSIEGVPTVSGEISVSFLREDGTTSVGQLYINPNPAKLWNNIPSDPNCRFWKEDNANKSLSTEQGRLIAARQRGRSHAHKGTCCDDDFALAYHQPTGLHFLAVADGAGSAEFSRQGSKLAVNVAKETALALLNDEAKSYKDLPNLPEESLNVVIEGLFIRAVQEAFKAQQTQANDAQIELKSLSCTLLLAFNLKMADGRYLTACYWVGDGAVASFNPITKQVQLLGEVDSGQYSGETQFLTFEEAQPEKIKTRIRTHFSNEPTILMLMTDGVSDPKFHTEANLQKAEHWSALFDEIRIPLGKENPAKALEDWLNFFVKGEHDDRTLALYLPTAVEQAIKQAEAQAVEPSAEQTAAPSEAQAVEQPAEQTDVNLAENSTALSENTAQSEQAEATSEPLAGEIEQAVQFGETVAKDTPVSSPVSSPVSLEKGQGERNE